MYKNLIISAFIAVFLFLTACGDDSTGPSKANLVGTWTMKTYKITVMGVSTGEINVPGATKTIFNNDNTYTGILISVNATNIDGSGTYKISGNKLILNETSEYNMVLTATNLTLTQTAKTIAQVDATIEMKFTKDAAQ